MKYGIAVMILASCAGFAQRLLTFRERGALPVRTIVSRAGL